MAIKGSMLLIGGGEYRGNNEQEKHKHSTLENSPLAILCDEPYNRNIEIITTGTAYPREAFEAYEDFFIQLGAKQVSMLDIDSRYIKDEELERIHTASAVFIGGGNQRKILEILSGTRLEDALVKRLRADKDFILAGTSAGSMCMGELTIGDGFHKQSIIKGDVDIRKGMNFLGNTVIDTHFILSARLARLSLALLENPGFLGIGIADNAGVLIRKGEILQHVGQEMVVLLDASEVEHTNISDAEKNDPVYASGLRMHFLHEGSEYSIKTGKLTTAKELIK